MGQQGYGLLKVTGKNQGLDGLLKDLGGRFSRRSRPVAAQPGAHPDADPHGHSHPGADPGLTDARAAA